MSAWRSVVAVSLCLALSLPLPAQGPASPAGEPPAPAAAAKTFSQPELDQILAPIALYPDALLAQVLMASTYPLEVVAADRWVQSNPGLKGKALEDALQSQPWDPAVKSLAVLPQVLAMMSQKLEWTYQLGDAFLAQQQDVMATAQALRKKALDAGNLEDTKEQKVTREVQENVPVIKIEPADPEVVYVPTYDPSDIYGPWPDPGYPPYYWYPPGYAHAPGMWFAAGVLIGAALWGNCIWGGPVGVNINVNRYNNFNRSNIADGNWGHRVEHRGGTPYRDQKVSQQYGRAERADAASREAYRGRTEGGSHDLGGIRSPTAFDTGARSQARDYSDRGASSVGAARSSGNFGGGGMRGGGGGRGGRR